MKHEQNLLNIGNERGNEVKILRRNKPEKLISFYLEQLDHFEKLMLKYYNDPEIILKWFDDLFNKQFLKTTKTGKPIWKIN